MFCFPAGRRIANLSHWWGKMGSLSANIHARCPLAAALSTALLVSILFTAGPAFAGPCEGLSALKLHGATITSAESVAAGAFTPPGSAAAPAVFKNAPAFCRVTAELKPSKDSDIKMEVWLPASGWRSEE